MNPIHKKHKKEIVKKNRLILAVDMEDKDRALEICEAVEEFVDAFKIGLPFVLSNGIESLKLFKKLDKPIIADFKVADIPYISRRICEIASKYADYVIVHGFLGEETIKSCSEVSDIFVVADMSHKGHFISKHSEEIAKIAVKYAKGVVAPATNPKSIRKIRDIVGDLYIISPGIIAQGAKVGDAIKNGADFEIVGRGIYRSKNPRETAKKLSEMLKSIHASQGNIGSK